MKNGKAIPAPMPELRRDEQVKRLSKLADRYADPVAQGLMTKAEFGGIEQATNERFLSALLHEENMCTVTGSPDYVLAQDIESHLAKFLRCQNASLPAAMAFLQSLKPNDPIEGMLISQMYATHALAMEFNARAVQNTGAGSIDSNLNHAKG